MAQTLTPATSYDAWKQTKAYDDEWRWRGTITVVDNYVTGGIVIPVPPARGTTVTWVNLDTVQNGGTVTWLANYVQPNLLQLIVRSSGAELGNGSAAAVGAIYDIEIWSL